MAEIEQMRERIAAVTNKVTSLETELTMREEQRDKELAKLKEEFNIEDPAMIQTVIEEKSAEIAKLRESINTNLNEVEVIIGTKDE